MRSSSFKSLIPAAAVAAILAAAPMQFGSTPPFGFAQAQAAITGSAAVANTDANGSSTTAHQALGQGAGNGYEASVTPYPSPESGEDSRADRR